MFRNKNLKIGKNYTKLASIYNIITSSNFKFPEFNLKLKVKITIFAISKS
jgi:hypothetical protein